MHTFNLGPKAIQEINRFQLVLNRFPQKERLSMIRFLTQTVTVAGAASGELARTTGNVRSIASARGGLASKRVVRGKRWTSRQEKLSKVAARRVRDSSGHFIPAGKRVRARTARARAA